MSVPGLQFGAISFILHLGVKVVYGTRRTARRATAHVRSIFSKPIESDKYVLVDATEIPYSKSIEA